MTRWVIRDRAIQAPEGRLSAKHPIATGTRRIRAIKPTPHLILVNACLSVELRDTGEEAPPYCVANCVAVQSGDIKYIYISDT